MLRSVCLGAFAAACILSPGIDAVAKTVAPDAAYAAFAKSYFYSGFAQSPSTATQAGLHEYDTRLDDLSPSHFAAQLALDASVLAALDKLDPKSLSPEVRIDRQMLIDAIEDDQLLTGTEANWRHNPDLYTQTVSGAIYGLMARDYAPLETRMRFTIARLAQVPRLLAQAKQNITTVDAATAEASLADASGAAAFFAGDVPLAFAGVKDAALQRELHSNDAAALAAVRAYAAWIKRGPAAHPAGTFAIGRAAYQSRLLHDDALTMPVEEYLGIGERALAATQAQFRSVAREIDPAHTPQQVYAKLALQHPTAHGLIDAAQQDIARLRTFIASHNIIMLPPDSDIKAVETPTFSRSQIFAAFSAPGPLEKVATQTYYYVTPPDATWSRDQQEKALGFLNDYSRPLISAHEVMPGHFVNYAIDKHLPLSLTRQLIWNSEFGEGWAHYDEQMVVDEGWGNGDPRVRLAQLSAALTREGRYVVGVKEHTQGMTLSQATKFLMDNAYMARATAHREALRGTQDPMYGYYTLGKLMILKLRADYQKKLGSAYTLQRFHDVLLAHGDPPIPLLRPLLLGAFDDGKPL